MKKIAIVGSINMDLTCKTERFPNAGETIFGGDLQYVPGGKGNNQAVAAARLGGDVTMFACVGDDAFGDRLIENLKNNGVKTEHMRKVPGAASGIAIITVAQQDNTIVVVSGANLCVTPQYIEEVKDAILESDIILLQNEIPAETLRYVVKMASGAGKTVIFNHLFCWNCKGSTSVVVVRKELVIFISCPVNVCRRVTYFLEGWSKGNHISRNNLHSKLISCTCNS